MRKRTLQCATGPLMLVFLTLLVAHLPQFLSVVTNAGYEKSASVEQNQKKKTHTHTHTQNITCTPLTVRKGTVPTSCGIPSCITGSDIIPGTYPWYVHTRKRLSREGRKRKGTLLVLYVNTRYAVKYQGSVFSGSRRP